MKGTISVATTSEEFEGAYRVRYKCLTEELGDERYADHDRKMYIDKMDKVGRPIVLLGKVGDDVVATVRIALRKHGPFTADKIYPYSRMAAFFNQHEEYIKQTLVLQERGAVLPEYRDKEYQFFGQLTKACYAEALKEDGQFIIGCVDTKNTASCLGLQDRYGWSIIDPSIAYLNKTYTLVGRAIPQFTHEHLAGVVSQ